MKNTQKNIDLSQDERFLRLLMSNQDKIFAFVLSLVHNSNDAEDIMQDTITVMWRKYDTFKPGTNFVAWGITIARFNVLRFFEKHRNSKLSFSPDLQNEIVLITTGKLRCEKESVLKALRTCLKKLDSRSYELIKLRYTMKKPTKMIADEKGIALHTMYRVMAKIHEMLHRCIKRSISVGESL